ncbi:MAG: hypothetical protein DMF61_11210 [Blastocatellia bacterium AA13]|nr:MAG: hypothetical protein DMF61_11210 [Blastocatellia bacterium AA13]
MNQMRMRLREALWLALVVCVFQPATTSAQRRADGTLDRAGAPEAIVVITGKDASGKAITPGLGFFIRGNLLLTDYQVVKDGITFRTESATQRSDAELVAVDKARLAALLLVKDTSKAPLRIGCPVRFKTGDRAYAFQGTSADSLKELLIGEEKLVNGNRLFRAEAAAGNEGGPILNEEGDVIGLVVRTRDEKASARLAAPLSYFDAIVSSSRECEPSTVEANRPTTSITGGVVMGGVTPAGSNSPSSPNVIRKTGGMVAGESIRRAQPMYPPLAKAARVSGPVIVELVIDAEGDVEIARATSGNPMLKLAAENAARAWKFKPTLLDGTAVAVLGSITFNFDLGVGPPPLRSEKSLVKPGAPSGSESEVMVYNRGSVVDTKPAPLNRPRPNYTPLADQNRIEGIVVLRILVDKTGKTVKVNVVRGLPDGLDDEAVRAAFQLRFKPAMKDGAPVAYQLNIEIEFKLK